MRYKILFVLIFLTFNIICFPQNKRERTSNWKDKNSWVSISLPFLWSKYEVTNLYGIFGTDNQSNGDSWSNGINVTYSRNVFKGFFALAGIGYFKQNFDFSKSRTPNGGGFRTSNSRPFDYVSPVQLLYSAKNYSYSNYHFLVGIGYAYTINKKWDIEGNITYNQMHTYRQKYYPENTSHSPQVNRLNYLFSKLFILSIGGKWKLNKNISAGINVLLPLSTKYRKDSIFRENTNEYFKPTSSFGTGLFTNYHF